jgi:hypothetical protein
MGREVAPGWGGLLEEEGHERLLFNKYAPPHPVLITIIFFGDTWSLNSGPTFAWQVLYHLSHASSHFCFSYFGIGPWAFAWLAPPQFSYLHFLSSWDDRCLPPHLEFYWLRWGSWELYSPGWPWRSTLPISTSWVAEIIDITTVSGLIIFY